MISVKNVRVTALVVIVARPEIIASSTSATTNEVNHAVKGVSQSREFGGCRVDRND
jgi:hypothetical protein